MNVAESDGPRTSCLHYVICSILDFIKHHRFGFLVLGYIVSIAQASACCGACGTVWLIENLLPFMDEHDHASIRMQVDAFSFIAVSNVFVV